MSKRRVYHVIPHRKGWRIRLNGHDVCIRATKASAVSDAVSMARSDWKRGFLAQVKIHNRDGRLAEERTYGKDPKRYKG